jgi:transcriptional regulator with XRE-family HTH domain
MPKLAKLKVKNLPSKLRKIRLALNLSQSQMLEKLGLADKSYRSAISGFERGTREPALPILLKYAKIAGLSSDFLLDDDIELPAKLPSDFSHDHLKTKK